MEQGELREIFQKGSRTYFNSTRFFPPAVRQRVTVLYAFVRTADDFVDTLPQDVAGWQAFKKDFHRALEGERTSNEVVDGFVSLLQQFQMDPNWVEAFFHSMEMDLFPRVFETLDQTLEYIYGSAEVIGLMMAHLMELPPRSFPYAQMLGRAMQYINFIRDIQEDLELGRQYIPRAFSEKHGLRSLERSQALEKPRAFEALVRGEVERYVGWQRQAEKGFGFLPLRYRIPVKTASDMYFWTAKTIAKSPLVVYGRKVKPSKTRILFQGSWNILAAQFSNRKGEREK